MVQWGFLGCFASEVTFFFFKINPNTQPRQVEENSSEVCDVLNFYFMVYPFSSFGIIGNSLQWFWHLALKKTQHLVWWSVRVAATEDRRPTQSLNSTIFLLTCNSYYFTLNDDSERSTYSKLICQMEKLCFHKSNYTRLCVVASFGAFILHLFLLTTNKKSRQHLGKRSQAGGSASPQWSQTAKLI